MVVIPLLRYFGSNTKAVKTIAIAATTSYAIIGRPSAKATPFAPIICSVDKLVSNKEPAITGPVKLLPPKKYPSEDFSSVLRVAK